ncbi:MAG: GAF domain-containing protein [Anaerolineae bacterium]
MGLGLLLFIGGLVIIGGLYLWSRQREALGYIPTPTNKLPVDVPHASPDDAVLVSREHGQLVFVNESARNWLGMNGGEPSLEHIAALAQPSDSFLELFAEPGQASFQLGSRWVEASSHTIPSGSESRTVVVMREIAGSVSSPGTLDLSLAMNTINEIGETINASMGIQQVYQALLTIVMKAIPAHAGEICIWDETNNELSPLGWSGDSAYLIKLQEVGGNYKLGEGISGWIAQYHKAILTTNVVEGAVVQPKLPGFYNSFVGVPLMLGERFIGTLELAHQKPDSFGQKHLALLQAVSKQIAISIYNTELYSQQAQRINDMATVGSLSEISDTSDDPRAVYRSLNARMAQILSASVSGILLYDENRRALVPELPFHGLPDHLAQSCVIPLPPDSPQRDIFERQEYWVTNDAYDEPLIEALGLKPVFMVAAIKNTALMPLQIGDQRIGMMQISNRKAVSGFNTQDIKEMKLLVAQAAVVVENLRLRQREQRRDTELSGLQEITHAIGSLTREAEFFSAINARIAAQMGVSMCGILLFDEDKHQLTSQLPFYGVDDAAVVDYQISFEPGSPLETIWDEVDYWFTNRAESDAVVHAAGLADFANKLGVKKTLLAALSVGGRRLGVVQISNKLNGEDFSDKDARLLLLFATQVAAMIENSRLYREMQKSAEQATSLRQVAELAGAVLTPEDSLKPVLAEISRLTRSPLVHITILDRQTGSLTTYPRMVFGSEHSEPVVFDIYQQSLESSPALTHRPLVTNAMTSDPNISEAYRKEAELMGLQRLVLVPLMVGDHSLGELGIANRTPDPYTETDVELMEAIASQISATIERLRLYEATGENLNRRQLELDAISHISNVLAETLDLDQVLDVIRTDSARATRADGSTLVLFKSPDKWPEPDQPVMDRRLGPVTGLNAVADIEREAANRGASSLIVNDYITASMHAVPSDARSAVAVGIVYEDRVVGVIHLFHNRPGNFDDRAAAFMVTLAAKASLGYGNYVRYQEQIERSNRLRHRVDQLNEIFELGQTLQGNIDQVELLETILESIQDAVGFSVGVVALVDDEAHVLRRVAQLGMPLEEFEHSKVHTMPVDEFEKMLTDPYRVSESFFFPAEQTGDWLRTDISALRMDFPGKRAVTLSGNKQMWQDGDMLLVLLHASDGRTLGVMSLDRPHDLMRPERSTMEVLEIFAHEAESNLENIRLYLESLQSAEQEARLNEMMEAISTSLDTTHIIEAVAYGALRLVPFNQMTVALADADADLQGYDVYKISINNDSSLVTNHEFRSHIESTALLKAMTDGVDILLNTDEPAAHGFEDIQAWRSQGEQISLVIPLLAGGAALGALHIGTDQRDATGFTEFRPLLKRIANLAAVAVQNARLFNQALNLRNFNESVVESIQQGIVVLDRSGLIISINDFMEIRYDWKQQEALRQDLFAYRPDLTDILKDDVLQVLETGEPREKIGQMTRLGGGQALVRNFYIYPLKSGDSIRGAVLLVEDVTERARLERDLEARANQLSALTEVSSRITASLNREEVINLALDEIGRVLQFDLMTLWTRSGDVLTLEGSSGMGDDVAVIDDELTQIDLNAHHRMHTVIERKTPFRIDHLKGVDKLPGDGNTQSWLGVPLVNHGNVVGVIALSKREPNFYDEQSEQATFAFANQVAIALENAALYTGAQHQTERLGLLNRVSVLLAQSLDSENILEIALREIAQTMKVPSARALIFERGLQIGQVVMQYPRGDEPPDETIDLQQSASYQLIRRSAAPIIVQDVAQLTQDDPLKSELLERGVRTFMMIPMTVAGQVIGAFDMEDRVGLHYFTPEQIDLALIIANQAAIAVQNTNLLEQTLIRTRELETLLEAAQATAVTLNQEEAFFSVTQLMLHALEMDDCAVLMWDNVENSLAVEVDVNRFGEKDQVVPKGTQFNLRQYPSRARALHQAEIIVITPDTIDHDPYEKKDLLQTGDKLRVLIPLVVRDQAIGLVQVQQTHYQHEFGHREVRLAQALGAQAATAIQNARLSTQTAALVEEGFLINNLSQAISATLKTEDIVAVIRDQIPRVTKAEQMYLAIYDPVSEMIDFPVCVSSGQPYEIPSRRLNTDEVSFIIKHRRSLSLGGGNFSSDDMRRNLQITNGEVDAKSYLGVPIAAGDVVMGVLALRDTQNTRAFGINDERLLTTVGSQLGAAFQNANLFEKVNSFNAELNQRVKERTDELQQERDRLDTLYRITSELARTLDMDRVLTRALETVVNAIGADEGAILLLDPLSDGLVPRAILSNGAISNTGDVNHPAHMLASWLLENDRLVIANDLHEEPYWDTQSNPEAAQWRSALGVLLESNDDPQGVLVLLNRQTKAFTETQLKLVIAAANQVAAAINNADLYHLIRDQAERLGTLVRVEQEESEKNSAIVEGIADGVMLADSEGAIVLFNSAAERILALSSDKVIGQSMFRLTGLFGGSATQWARAIDNWTKNPDSFRPGDYLQETLEIGQKVVQVHLSPVYTGGRFLGTVSVFRDITREVEADRVKSEFVSNVSHELRTPMTSIKGFADLMLMGVAGDMNEGQRGFLNKIKNNADRLSKLVEDLLDISKLDAGEQLEIETVDLKDVLNTSLNTVKSRAENTQKEMNVSVNIGRKLPDIQGDSLKLTQVFTNLIDNAFNYTEAGGSIDISAAVEADGKRVIISIKDTGIGIPEDFKPRIWGRFERYEDHALVMDVPGTGLGLSIVRELVLMHNGDIWFESESGKGTTFFVALPLEQPEPSRPSTN